jgi:hypothetical protein
MARVTYTTQEGDRPKRQFDPVPPGIYSVEILSEETITDPEKPEGQKAKVPSKVQVKIRFRIIEGKYSNRNLFDRLFLEGYAPRAREIAEDKLREIGSAIGEQVEDTGQLVGHRLRVRVSNREWNGKTQEQVEEYLPPLGESTGNAPDEDLPF